MKVVASWEAPKECALPSWGACSPGFKSRQSSMTLIPQPLLHRIASFAHGTLNFPESDLSLKARGELTPTATSFNDRASRIPSCTNSDYGIVHTSQGKSAAITSSGDMKQTAFPSRQQKETTTSACSFRKEDNSLSAATDEPCKFGDQTTSQHRNILPRTTPQGTTATAEPSQTLSVTLCHMTTAASIHHVVAAALEAASQETQTWTSPSDNPQYRKRCPSNFKNKFG